MEAPNNEPSGIMPGLPPGHITLQFRSMESLTASAKDVLGALNENDDGGNQYIVVLNLPNAIRSRLDEDKNSLAGIPFRLMFEGTTGLIKVIPSYVHGACTRRFSDTISRRSWTTMGVPLDDFEWASTTTYWSTVGSQSGNQPDDCFLPRSRQGFAGQSPGWPTLVIETGISESLSKLHEDAKWWFQNSSGLIRTVIVISVGRVRRTIRIQKWQLVPPSTRQPVTPVVIQRLQRMVPPPMPPLVQQQPPFQTPYISQDVTITPTIAVGALPLVLHFHALFDRAPQGAETDILLTAPDLVRMATYL